jgi:XTP/dITP diphosphohydrolase
VRWLTLADAGLDQLDVEETGETFFDNAVLKVRVYQARSGLPTLADDSGLAVDALGGAPGVRSARYAPTAPERNARLLKALEGVPARQRTARFVCVVAFLAPDGLLIAAEGRVEGTIGAAPRGTNGFGYDPVFLLDGRRMLAELPTDEKNQISHRGRALARLRPLLACLFNPVT